jgi:predicted nucleotidyltransferase
MKSTTEYIRLLKQFKDNHASRYGIQKIGLFGSVARGEHKEGSDVDVCFEGVPQGFFAVGGMKVDLEQLFGCSVDVVRLREKMDSFFKEQIQKEVIYV